MVYRGLLLPLTHSILTVLISRPHSYPGICSDDSTDPCFLTDGGFTLYTGSQEGFLQQISEIEDRLALGCQTGVFVDVDPRITGIQCRPDTTVTPISAESRGNSTPAWGWVLIGCGAFIVVSGGLLMYLRRSRRQSQEQGEPLVYDEGADSLEDLSDKGEVTGPGEGDEPSELTTPEDETLQSAPFEAEFGRASTPSPDPTSAGRLPGSPEDSEPAHVFQ
jgi:hypothetical protein